MCDVPPYFRAPVREALCCLTVLATFAKTLSWKDCSACRLSPWFFPPADMALARTPAHCSVPCVATGRSTLSSALTAAASKASNGSAAMHLQHDAGRVSNSK